MIPLAVDICRTIDPAHRRIVIEALSLYPILYLNLTAALANLDPALDLMSDVALRPTFAAAEVEPDLGEVRGIEVLPLCLAGDMQGAMQKLHSAEKDKAVEKKPAAAKAIEARPAEKKPEPPVQAKPEPKVEPAREKEAPAKGLFGALFSGRKK